MYEKQRSTHPFIEPTELVEKLADLIDNYEFEDSDYRQTESLYFSHKEIIPKKQILALYAINKISSITNKILL